MTSLSFQDIGLKPATLQAVARKAKGLGQSPPEYVRSLIERDLLSDQPFDRMLSKVREDVQKRGMTEKDIDDLVKRARKRPTQSSRGRQ